MDEPLIFTTKGNLPIAELAFGTRWEVTEDFIKLIEIYRLGDEVVRESAHVLKRKSIDMGLAQASFS